MKEKVYIETTIISYLTAQRSKNTIIAGRQELTEEWWNNCRNRFHLTISELVYQEASMGDRDAAKKRMAHLETIDSLHISDEAILLGNALVNEGPIPREYAEDALHIAICAVNGIDFLLTWNCKHLANAFHRLKIESIVTKQGYQCPIICTPAELMED